MRCPKCGYITFDHLETCTKCGKNIAAVSEALSGTVFKAEPPAFLQFKVHETDTAPDDSIDLLQEDSETEVHFSFDDEESVSDNFLDDDDIEFDFLDEMQDSSVSQADNDDGGAEFDMALFDDDSAELVLDEGGEAVGEDQDGPQLDFSELDISDLAPPAVEEGDLTSLELTLEETDAPIAPAPASGQPSLGIGAGLEDLQMDGLDLEMPSLPPVGSATGKKMRPTVKTGTALDDFDIDLGELLSEKKK